MCMCIACALHVRCIRIACALHVRCMCIACALHVHCVCTVFGWHVRCMYIACALRVYVALTFAVSEPCCNRLVCWSTHSKTIRTNCTSATRSAPKARLPRWKRTWAHTVAASSTCGRSLEHVGLQSGHVGLQP